MLENQIFGNAKAHIRKLVIYPSRWRLFTNILLAPLLCFFSSVTLIIHVENIPSFEPLGTIVSFSSFFTWSIEMIGFSLMFVSAGLMGILCAYRLLVNSPTLVVDHEGMHIIPFLFPWRAIMITWEEITTISSCRLRVLSSKSRPALFASLQSYSGLFIALVPQCEEPVLMRQNRFNRAFIQRNKMDYPLGIYIPRLLLPISEKKFLSQLQDRYQIMIEQYNIHISIEA